MWGIDPKVQRSFDRAQASYEAMEPPGWDAPDYDDDCDGNDCGTCESCVIYAKEYAAELAAENAYDRMKEEGF